MSHELVGGAAAYYVRLSPLPSIPQKSPTFPLLTINTKRARIQAAREYEKHCAQNGKPDSHAQAKELLAGFAGAFIDREFETKGVSALSSLLFLSLCGKRKRG